MINKNFVSDLAVIDEALTEPLKSSKLFDSDENIEIILSSMIQIIREFEVNNHVEKSASEFSEFVEELINDNELLIVNEPDIVKAKGRSKGTRNKKEVMTQAEKTKAKFIKRDPSDFEHVKVNLRRDGRGGRDDRDDHDGRDDRGDRDDRDDDNNRSSEEVKKSSVTNTVTIMEADIQAIKKASAVINRDVQAILTRAEAKAKTKRAAILTRAGAKAKPNTNASNDLIVNIDKTAIDVSSDEEFEVFITDEEVMEEAMNMSS